jgi:hypothetical protein
MQDPLFLGLDLSTQGLKGVLITEDSAVVHESAVNFDKDLPAYGTTNGAIRGPGGQVTSPVKMWLDAMDLLMDRMKQAGVQFNRIAAISGDGQVRAIPYLCPAPTLTDRPAATRIGLLVTGCGADPRFPRLRGSAHATFTRRVLTPRCTDLARLEHHA